MMLRLKAGVRRGVLDCSSPAVSNLWVCDC